MKKILIIGKKSFLGSNLKIFLSKFYKVDKFSFEEVLKKKSFFFKNFSHVINTSIHKNYVNSKYNAKFDLDKIFISKFEKVDFYYIFLNSRKIYFPKNNIKENSKISPIDNYGKNKFLTEKFLKKKLKNKLVSLRISNVLGTRIYKNLRNNHKLFFDNFLEYKRNNKEITFNDDFKDFITIKQFSNIISKIIKLEVTGIYNVSLGKKIYVSEIVKWLDQNLYKKIKFTDSSKDSFTLSNKKLLRKIKINITKNQVKSFCKSLIK